MMDTLRVIINIVIVLQLVNVTSSGREKRLRFLLLHFMSLWWTLIDESGRQKNAILKHLESSLAWNARQSHLAAKDSLFLTITWLLIATHSLSTHRPLFSSFNGLLISNKPSHEIKNISLYELHFIIHHEIKTRFTTLLPPSQTCQNEWSCKIVFKFA